jgi:hypothetical protein
MFKKMYFGHVKGNHHSWTDRVGRNLLYANFQKDQSAYLHYSGMESDINDVWESGIVFSNHITHMHIVTFRPSNLKAMPSHGNFGIKVFNCLPADIKELSDDIKCFKNALKRFFHLHSFYSVEEYFNYNIMN